MQKDNITLNTAFEEYIALRRDLRPSTLRTYRQCYHHVQKDLGEKRLKDIRYSHIKAFYMHLKYDKGLSARSIELISSMLHPVFELAVRDDILQKNPSQGVLKEVCRGDGWEKARKPALSARNQKRFMTYVRESPRYRRWSPLFAFLFGTGLRIGEAAGLKWEDIDLKAKTISVKRSLSYMNKQSCEGRPKTKAGERLIPLLPEVEKALKEEQKRQALCFHQKKFTPGPYVFLNGCKKPHLTATVNQAIDHIINAYSRDFPNEDPISHFSVHQMRHTFCTRLCENEVNIKVIQSVMGHSDIETTMNIYAEVSMEKKQETFKNLPGKVVL